MVYNSFKNDFISNLCTTNIRLNESQINKILCSLDNTASKYAIFHKNNLISEGNTVIPRSVYSYVNAKKAEGCAAGTLYIYRTMLETFFRSVSKQPQAISPDDIRDFLMKYQQINPVSNRTLDKYRGYICAYFTWMHDYGAIPINPARMVSSIKFEVKPRDIITDYEAELLREACYTRRERALLEFLLSTACRIGEVVVAKVTDINWDNRSIVVFGKGSKYRTVFFDARTQIALERYLQYRNGISEYLFIHDKEPFKNLTVRAAEVIINNIVARVPQISENKHITPHRFRSTQATRLYNKGMAISDISKLLGHKRIDTTAIYLMDDVNHLQTEYNKYQ